ncbi:MULTISPECIES: alpha/beta hydrolase [unclassified Sphingobacterium]|uniref:alpha/beta hydrolase n=1 Tax=unclassified Sphingobacterium TaxID=2609468 RepID=UPI0025EF9611|nr:MULTISPECIES: alpha/beta hydrolase [unclassified Sphingobacterium]
MKKIYVISGLGVDKRVFSNIDFNGLDVEYLDWIPPHSQESIEQYAARMTQMIHTDNPTIIGLSFGGMVAVEISKLIVYDKLILLASAKTRHEIPALYRLLGRLKLHKIFPPSLFKSYNPVLGWLFGIHTAEDKQLLKEILKDTDPLFMTWAINEILNWKNLQEPTNYIHIHGTKDNILPAKNVKNIATRIEDAGHFMTVNQSKTVSEELFKVINRNY